MWRVFLLVLAFTLAGCRSGVVDESLTTSEPVPKLEDRPADETDVKQNLIDDNRAPQLANLGAAPELTNQVWLNSDEVLRLADLRGKVVLLEMWTFG